MPDAITLTGLVATPPRHLVTSEGLPITSFRLASTQRRFDRPQQKWIDGDASRQLERITIQVLSSSLWAASRDVQTLDS